MQTIFGSGDGKEQSFMDKLWGGKRVLTGESLFMTTYTNDSPSGARPGSRRPIRQR